MNNSKVNVVVSGHRNEYYSVYKTYILRGGVPFADQVIMPDTKYVIKYNFNLGGGAFDIDFTNADTHTVAEVTYYYIPLIADGSKYTLMDDTLVFVDAGWNGLSAREIKPEKGTLFMIASITGGLHKNGYGINVVTVPKNCILEFDGGSLKNGVITFNNTFLNGDINIDCEFHGTVSNARVFSNWFNTLAHPVRTINNMIEVADCIFLGDGIYLIDGIYNNKQLGYFQLKSGLKIEGESKTGTIIKLGENRYSDGKSIFYGYEINDLEVTNITFDINGKENIIPSKEIARWTNLRIIEVKYGSNINIHNVNMKDNPGRQCISLGKGDDTHPDNYPIKNVRIEDCQFFDTSRSSEGGMYQNDHSSIFTIVDTLFVNNNYFCNSKENTESTMQKSSAIEVHGINIIVTNNTTINYSRGVNVSATKCNSRSIIVKDNIFKNVTCAIMLYKATALSLKDIFIFNNNIYCVNINRCGGIQQYEKEGFTSPDSCIIKNNFITGNNILSGGISRGAIYFNIKNNNSYIEISDNTIKNFNACAINVQNPTEVCDSFLSITNNIFDNCGSVETSTTARDNNIVYNAGLYIKTFIFENNKVVNSPRADICFLETSITTAITLIIKGNICCDCVYISFVNSVNAKNIVFDAIAFDSIDIFRLGGTNVSYKNGIRKYQKIGDSTAQGYVKSIAYGTSVPTDGSWEKGDLIINYDAKDYAPLGWVCTRRGIPGTWRPIGFTFNGDIVEGVTNNRPTNAILGTQYIDRTLGYSIEYNGSKWIDWDGATAGVLRSGTFANKPTASDIYVGFKYFCTNKQTTEGATDGIEIIHKGNDVWVDALGRVVS